MVFKSYELAGYFAADHKTEPEMIRVSVEIPRDLYAAILKIHEYGNDCWGLQDTFEETLKSLLAEGVDSVSVEI